MPSPSARIRTVGGREDHGERPASLDSVNVAILLLLTAQKGGKTILLVVGLGEDVRVPPFPLSSFQRLSVTLELRFDEAFVLWDTTGDLWQTVRRQFKTLKSAQVTPNQTSFHADNRFTLVVALDRTVITDHKPSGGAAGTFDAMTKFVDVVTRQLQVRVLNRVGTRFIYSIRCKDLDEARAKLAKALPLNLGGTTFFNIKPEYVSPLLKFDVNDGELGYSVQVNANERKYNFDPPPEVVALNLEARNEAIAELMLDIDLFTVKPIPTESFDIQVWLSGCNKSVSRDADKLLDFLKGIE